MIAPFESRNKKLVTEWNAWVDSLREIDTIGVIPKKHKPNASAYGICKKCRDYFDGQVEDRGDDSGKHELHFDDDDAEHADMDRNDEQAMLDADEARDMAQMSEF